MRFETRCVLCGADERADCPGQGEEQGRFEGHISAPKVQHDANEAGDPDNDQGHAYRLVRWNMGHVNQQRRGDNGAAAAQRTEGETPTIVASATARR